MERREVLVTIDRPLDCEYAAKKRLTALHVAEEFCAPVPHRQIVLTIPKRLRLYTRFDRRLLGKFSHCAWKCIQAEARRFLGHDDVESGMVVAIQTHRKLLYWHPRLHAFLTCGAFTPARDFLTFPQLDLDRLEVAWQESVFALLFGRGENQTRGRREHAHLGAQRL